MANAYVAFLCAVLLVLLRSNAAWTSKTGSQRAMGTRLYTMVVPKKDTKVREYATHYEELGVDTKKGIFLVDLTPLLRAALKSSGITEGVVTVLSRHTTTAITINEMEGRLVDDIRQYLLRLAPPDYPYLHNDLHLRNGPPGWPGGDEAWRAQEPVNAHSHLLTMLLGSSASVPVHCGDLKIGTWQSVILAEMDGPRTRTVAVQITGTRDA